MVRAEEQPGGDVGVGEAVGDEAGSVLLLRVSWPRAAGSRVRVVSLVGAQHSGGATLPWQRPGAVVAIFASWVGLGITLLKVNAAIKELMIESR